MDHKALIASLNETERAELTATSNAAGLRHLAGHAGAIALLAAIIASGMPGWPLALVPLGILVVFLFTLMHEASHRTAFRSEWLNDICARAAGFLLFLPPEWFRYFHFAHHRHTQDPARDPELAAPKPETRWQYLKYVSGFPVWRGNLTTLLRNAWGSARDAYVPEKARRRIVSESRQMLAAYAVLLATSVLIHSTMLLWVWLIPALLGQPFLRLYLLAEHGRCPFVQNMLENSRTTFTNRLVRAIAWNMPYHAEHHAYPAVPFHKLPQFHALAARHVKVTERGYARFNANYVAALKR
ncbi:MAG: fatty acid desaturase [Hyphomicrobiales bacterium]